MPIQYRTIQVGNYLTNYLKIGDDLTLLVLRVPFARVLCGLRTGSGMTYMESRFFNRLLAMLLVCGILPLVVLYVIYDSGDFWRTMLAMTTDVLPRRRVREKGNDGFLSCPGNLPFLRRTHYRGLAALAPVVMFLVI